MDVKCVSFVFLVQIAISHQQTPPLSPSTLPQSTQQNYFQTSSSNPSPDLSKGKRGLSGVADSLQQGSSSVISLPIHVGRHYPVHRSLGVPLPVPVRVTVPRSYPVAVLLEPSAAALEYALGLYGHYGSASSLDYNTLLTYLAATRAASHLNSHLNSHLTSHLSSSTAHSEHSALANYAALTAAAAAKLT